MKKCTLLSLNRYDLIKIVSIEFLEELGTPAGRNSTNAHYKVRIQWTDPDIDAHVAELEPKTFLRTNRVSIEAFSKNIIGPGTYKRVRRPRFVFIDQDLVESIENPSQETTTTPYFA